VYKAVVGSDRVQPGGVVRLGPVDPGERMTVRVVLRRRAPVPAASAIEVYLHIPAHQRQALSAADLADRFGAVPSEVNKVVAFLRSAGLTVEEADQASRTVTATGTAAQMSSAFGVTLHQYRASLPQGSKYAGAPPGWQTHRSYEGSVHVLAELSDIIVGVFGLDDRIITGRNAAGDPPNTMTTTVPLIMQRYNFPTNSAAGQTVGIFAAKGANGTGYAQSDIDAYYAADALRGFKPPTIVLVDDIDGTQNSSTDPDGETTQDICIASTVAQEAIIAVYLNAGDENGWLAALKRATFPSGGDPIPSVLSSSFFICEGDDPAGRALRGIPTSFLDAASLAFQDAAVRGHTVCVASGDAGTDSNVGDGSQHVQYPGSDPWVLCCGGTTVGANAANQPVEYVLNDTVTVSVSAGDTVTVNVATGGGVSAYFAQPDYQSGIGIPKSLATGQSGRGVPDVAGNASWNSGYFPMYTIGNDPNPWNANGTSAVAPLYAGLIAVVNAALGYRAGFVNPLLYSRGSELCRDVDPTVVGGPDNNGLNGVAGYPAGKGWDACTGWGTIDGTALLDLLRQGVAVSGADCGVQVGCAELASIIAHANARGADCGVQVGRQAAASVMQPGGASGAGCGVQIGRAELASIIAHAAASGADCGIQICRALVGQWPRGTFG
jgi:kumamolisin